MKSSDDPKQTSNVSLPADLWGMISLNLTPEQGAALAMSFRQARRGVNATTYKEKLKLHFPVKYVELAKKEEVNWKQEFVNAYRNAYPWSIVTQRVRNLFSALIEEDIEALKQMSLTTNDLNVSNQNKNSLLQVAIKTGNQQILDWMFDQILNEYSSKEDGLLVTHKDYAGKTLLHYAIYLHQSPLTIAELLARGCNAKTSYRNISTVHLAAQYNPEVLDLLLRRTPEQLDGLNPTGSTPLTVTVLCGHTAAAVDLLKRGADVNKKDVKAKCAALHYAAAKGNAVVVEEMIKLKADVEIRDSDNKLAVHLAAENGHLDVVTLFVAHKPTTMFDLGKAGMTPLAIAAANGNKALVTYLLEREVYFEQTSMSLNQFHINGSRIKALCCAIEKGHTAIAKQILWQIRDISSNDVGISTAVDTAVKAGNLVALRNIINHIDYRKISDEESNAAYAKRMTPRKLKLYGPGLLTAAEAGKMDCIKLLIEKNPEIINYQNNDGETALTIAAKKGHTAVVEYLLEQGADPDLIENKESGKKCETALLHAVRAKNKDMVKLLLPKMKEINQKTTDSYKETAMHCAAIIGDLEIVKMLAEKDHDQVNALDAYGCTAAQYATVNGKNNVFNYLVSVGADLSIKILAPGHSQDGYSIKEIASDNENEYVFNIIKLMKYIEDINERIVTQKEYKYSFKLFGKTFLGESKSIFGHRYNLAARDKLDAAIMLLNVYLSNDTSEACLDKYKAELSNGSLAKLHKGLRASR